MSQTMGKYHQFLLISKIHAAFGGNEFVAEDLNRHGIRAQGGSLSGMVAIGLLSRKRIHKQARNKYTVNTTQYEMLRNKWK